jgi:hypothetical protein
MEREARGRFPDPAYDHIAGKPHAVGAGLDIGATLAIEIARRFGQNLDADFLQNGESRSVNGLHLVG